MDGIQKIAEATLNMLNRVEVRGKDNVVILGAAMINLENIVKAFGGSNEEAKAHDADDGQGQGV